MERSIISIYTKKENTFEGKVTLQGSNVVKLRSKINVPITIRGLNFI
jgi:hypothetical protein